MEEEIDFERGESVLYGLRDSEIGFNLRRDLRNYQEQQDELNYNIRGKNA